MSQLILIANDKGGVGKSTLAPELCLYLYDLKRTVAVIDADRSLACARHVNGAEKSIPVGALFDVDAINRAVPELRKKHDFIVADAPANLGKETLALMTHADVVLIPTEASLKPFESTVRTFEAVEKAREATGGNPRHVFVFFNKVDMRRKKKAELYRERAEASGLPLMRSQVRLLTPFADAEELETTVSRMKSTPKTREAQLDLTSVFAEMFEAMQTRNVANG